MTTDNYLPINEGEGSAAGAKKYNRDVRKFATEGRVEPAAKRAEQAFDAKPIQHAAAESAGRAPARGEDPALARPAWWTGEHESRWARFAAAIRRDWEQTMYHLSGGSTGTDLDQGLMDTLRQMRGTQQIPPGAEPPGVTANVDWGKSEQAVRYGFGAADRFAGRAWSVDIERALMHEWHTLPGAPPWEDVRTDVYIGWHQRRSRAS